MRVTAAQMAEKKLGITKLQEIAVRFNARLVSTFYADVKTPYEWSCSQGHRVVRTVPSIERSGHLCLVCNSFRDSTSTLREFAASQGGQFLSAEYTKAVLKYAWACNRGHTFHRSWSAMKTSKSFCPKCGRNEQKLS
jgi:rRNA maturation endonuclease Nob1